MGRKIAPSLFATLTWCGVWTGQPLTAHAETNWLAQRPAPVCHPVGKDAVVGDRLQRCAEWMTSQRSLTVIGLGQATAPADVALLEFRFGGQMGSESTVPGLSIQTARKATEAALQPVVKALTAIGVDARNITIQTNSVQSPKVLVRIDKPIQERLQQVVQTVDQALKGQPLFLQSIGAGYAVNSCEALQRSARRIALRDAQGQLKTLAQDVGVQLGELLSVTVLPLEGAPNSVGCGSKVGVPNSVFPITIDDATPPYNPSDQPVVQVRSQVSVTHAIKSGSDR